MENIVLGHELAISKKYVIFYNLRIGMQTSDTLLSRLLRQISGKEN